MIDLTFANEKIEKRIMTYIEAFRNAGISGTFHFPGRILSKEDWVPCVVKEDGAVFFTPYKEEAMRACYAVADSLPISMMLGLHLATYHDFYEDDSYAKYREGEWMIEVTINCLLVNPPKLIYNKRKGGPMRPAEGGTHEVGGYLRVGSMGRCLRESGRGCTTSGGCRFATTEAEGGTHAPSRRRDPRSGGMPSRRQHGEMPSRKRKGLHDRSEA